MAPIGYPPARVCDRYAIDGLARPGGTGDLFEAHDLRLDRPVRVKVLRPAHAERPERIVAFGSAVRRWAALDHANIVTVLDFCPGEDSSMLPALPSAVLERVSGSTLEQLLAGGQPVEAARALELAIDILSGLAHAATRSVVHAGVKPGVVWVRPAGPAMLADFGIAHAMGMFTIDYVAPEQLLKQPVDARTDVYSTAAVLFHLLTGQPPFPGHSPLAKAYSHVHRPAPAPSGLRLGLDRRLDVVLSRALAKDPAQRYAGPRQFLAAVRQVIADLGTDPVRLALAE